MQAMRLEAAPCFEVNEVAIEQWLLAAIRSQHAGMLLAQRGYRRRATARVEAPSKTRSSLWLLLAISCLGMFLL